MAKGKYERWRTPEGLALLEGWARDGLTDEQIAHNCGIRRETLYAWKKSYSNISNALKKGKEVVDQMVAGALLKRASGMTVTNTTYKMVKVDPDVLKVRRVRFLNGYRLDHPDMTKEELTMVAIEKVPTYEKIPIIVTENELAPSETAAMFWLKNRKPDQFRDKSFTGLNQAQAEKAKEDARKAKADADVAEYRAKILTDAANTEDRTVIIDDIPYPDTDEPPEPTRPPAKD